MAAPLSKAESSYTAAGLLNSVRPDGRSLLDYRPITLSTGVAPGANGSARARIGETDVVVAVKLDVRVLEPAGDEDDDDVIDEEAGAVSGEEGKFRCSVECSPSAFPHLDRDALSDLSSDLTSLLSTYLSTPRLLPDSQLSIVPRQRAWQPSIDALILSHSGNLHDTLFSAVRGALWDLRIPRTKSVAYEAPAGAGGGGGVDVSAAGAMLKQGVLDRMRELRRGGGGGDFELEDGADEGVPLVGREDIPVCLTMNLLTPVYYLDATATEEACTPSRLLLFVRPSGQLTTLQKLGSAELTPMELKRTLQDGVKHAREMAQALDVRLKDPAVRSKGSNLGPFS